MEPLFQTFTSKYIELSSSKPLNFEVRPVSGTFMWNLAEPGGGCPKPPRHPSAQVAWPDVFVAHYEALTENSEVYNSTYKASGRRIVFLLFLGGRGLFFGVAIALTRSPGGVGRENTGDVCCSLPRRSQREGRRLENRCFLT